MTVLIRNAETSSETKDAEARRSHDKNLVMKGGQPGKCRPKKRTYHHSSADPQPD